MRKLLVTSLIALLSAAASAQTTSRTGTSATKTSAAPSTAAQQGTSATVQKTADQPAATKARQSATAPSTNSTSHTSQSKTATQTTGSTSLTDQSAGTTARGASTTTAKTTEVKAVVNPVRVKWMTLEEALEKSKTDKRKIFVDVYTDWCGWCKRMDSTTFVSPAVVQYLNDHFYPVKFNAEQQNDIVFKDKTYQFKKNGARGYHELAATWLNNRLSYPTVVFLDESQGTIQPLPGYQDATKMEAVLNYFGTDSHKKTPWETYQKNFKTEKE